MALMNALKVRRRLWRASLGTLAIGMAVFAGYAQAGKRSDLIPTVTVLPGVGAWGTMSNARAAKDATNADDGEFVRVEALAWNDGTDEIRCTFGNAAGTQLVCVSYVASIVAAVQQAASDSRVTVTLDPANLNNCATVNIMNSSEYAPKVP